MTATVDNCFKSTEQIYLMDFVTDSMEKTWMVKLCVMSAIVVINEMIYFYNSYEDRTASLVPRLSHARTKMYCKQRNLGDGLGTRLRDSSSCKSLKKPVQTH